MSILLVADRDDVTEEVAPRGITANARQFYEHYGFTPTPRPDRLVRKVSDIEADIKTP